MSICQTAELYRATKRASVLSLSSVEPLSAKSLAIVVNNVMTMLQAHYTLVRLRKRWYRRRPARYVAI